MIDEHSTRINSETATCKCEEDKKSRSQKKRKLHNKATCLVCEEDLNEGSMILHKTRRQTHALCPDCIQGYIVPILENMTDKLRQNLRHKVSLFKCPGNVNGEHRNMCNHEVDALTLYMEYYVGKSIKLPPCPRGNDCRKISFKDAGNIVNTPGLKMCKLFHRRESLDSYTYRTGIQMQKPPILNSTSEMATMMFRIHYVVTHVNAYVCPNRQCGEIIHSDNDYESELNCVSCKTTWCKNCNVSPFHKNMSCHSYEAKESKTEDGQYKWKLYREGRLKDCPKCRSPAMKTEGCNKMNCTQCGIKWCWVCRAADINYEHFNDQSKNPCAGRLWENRQPEIEQDNDVMPLAEPRWQWQGGLAEFQQRGDGGQPEIEQDDDVMPPLEDVGPGEFHELNGWRNAPIPFEQPPDHVWVVGGEEIAMDIPDLIDQRILEQVD